MNKTIRTILCTVVFAVLAVSCQKGIGEVEPLANTKETIEISINGLMGEYTQVDVTKASLVNNVRVSWEGGETVYVFDGSQCLGSLVASLDENGDDRYARLSTDDDHTVNAPVSGTEKLTLVYSPLLTEAPSVSGGTISISLADQSGAKAPFVAYAILDYNNEESINNALVPFKFATSVIKVNCTGLKANTAIASATLSNVNTACKLTLSGTAAPTVTGAAKGTITRTNDTYFAAGKVNGEGVAVFQIAAPVLETASDARVLTISQGSNFFEYRYFSTKALSVATSVNTVCQTTAIPSGAMLGVFTVSSDGGTKRQVRFSQGNLTYNVSTPKWAFYEHQYDCASAYDANLISLFTWGYNAEQSIDPSGRDSDNVSRTSGNLSQDEDWGSRIGDGNTWRTLTKDEWEYLFDNHSKKWSSVNGVNGYVIAPDGFSGELADSYADDAALAADKLVFLPAAGLRQGLSVILVSSDGFYWSSSAGSERSYCLWFSNLGAQHITDQRFLGFSVRLVTDVVD